MKVRWTQEAIGFLEAREDYSPGLGMRILVDTEEKLRTDTDWPSSPC